MFMPGFWSFRRPTKAQPDLEVRHRLPVQPRFRTPIVFVHGAFVGAWCWDEHFLSWFADQGFEVYAPSLRGHGGSGGRLDSSGILDYVDDLASVTSRLPVAPVIVGHSMGALVTQRYLEAHSAPASVLMASVPLAGLTESSMRLISADPALFGQMALMQIAPGAVDPQVAQRAMFSNELDSELLARYAKATQPESQHALWDMTLGVLPRPWMVARHPMLVLGAANDRLFSPSEVRRTAQAYEAPVHIEPDMAHAMMIEPGWQSVAERIRDWLVASGID